MKGLVKGIGDDAAIFRTDAKRDLVISCDAFLEGVHFPSGLAPGNVPGYKALARAVSDLAAMGARPRYFLMTLAIPDRLSGRWLEGFLQGMARAAGEFEIELIGGDTTRPLVVRAKKHEAKSIAGLSVAVTVIGEVPRGRAVTRCGARPKDLIYVSGEVGGAQAGLEILLRQSKQASRLAETKTPDGSWPHVRKHLRPQPRLALGAWLAEERLATSMIDTSDGLSTDVFNLCQASSVGARLWSERLPVVILPNLPPGARAKALRMALHGGEDYELLFTVSPRNRKKIPARWKGLGLTWIGEITREKKTILIQANGKRQELPARGWDPFRKARS